MAYALTMLLLLGVMVILLLGTTAGGAGGGGGGGALTSATGSLLLTATRARSMGAVAVAEAGAELTLQWLHTQPVPPAQTTAFAPALWGATQSGQPTRACLNYPDPSDSSQCFRVLIYPDAGNAGTQEKKYLIESVGTSGGITQVARVFVQLESLGHFAYFSDSSSTQSCWVGGVNTFDGPVHCNNTDGTPTTVVWKTAGTPLFLDAAPDALTVSGAQINWRWSAPATAGGPQSPSDWQSVAAGGAADVHAGVPTIPFPVPGTLQHDTALGGATAPTSAGVLVPSRAGAVIGGIYVHGDVQSITLRAEKGVSGQTDVQDFFVQPAGLIAGVLAPVTEVRINPEAGTTTVSVFAVGVNLSTVLLNVGVSLLPISVTTLTGLPNGVLYCDGNIGGATLPPLDGVSGTIADNQTASGGQIIHANAWTIATGGSGTLAVGSSVTYNTARQTGGNGRPVPEGQDATFTQRAGELGLLSGTISVEAQSLQGVTLAPVEVDAALLAFDTCQASLGNLLLPGTFITMGNFVVGRDGSFGGLNGLLGQYGFTTTRYYDARLDVTPPPTFPMTTNQYAVLSWQVAPTTAS